MTTTVQSGIAAIKPEFICQVTNKAVDEIENRNDEPQAKKPKFEKKKRGQNKNRYASNVQWNDNSKKLCQVLIDVLEGDKAPVCTFPGCKKMHDVKEYLLTKPPDLEKECHVFRTTGRCPRGVTCLFASEHITADGKNKVNLELFKESEPKTKVIPSLAVKNLLRKKKYDFSKANRCVKQVNGASKKPETVTEKATTEEAEEEEENGNSLSLGPSCDEKPLSSPRERKKIDWRDKLYLSPLTTLGNLPFRRICKEWGADITCGEMALAIPLLNGSPSEWALTRKHHSEDLFGVQVCGTNPETLARCSQLIEENTDADFIDLNVGCPVDLVYKKGGGSALLRREKHLESILRSMVLTTEKLPVTIKTRTGIYDDKRVAHNLMPIFSAAGVSLITVHGRTREQRYVRFADWDYIEECAKNAQPTPVFGNGDIFSYDDYCKTRAAYPHIAGVMIGRGALYKPWIFTEIKEQRQWDISSKERFEILRKFVNYGFEHWGSDQQGVSNTRRFLLEWLSFLHRYIPVGVLERPQKISERPTRYVGRDDLETLMASPNCNDWIKISEMLCGPVSDDFQFVPKHKASSWASQ